MIAINISVYGHGCCSKYVYNADGEYKEIILPIGALLIGRSIHPSPQPDEKALSAYSEEYRCVVQQLKRFEDAQGRSYHAISRCLGYQKGLSEHSIYTHPGRPGEPCDLIVWDEGFGGLQVPRDSRSVLWASNKALPDRAQFEAIANKTLLFLDADVLRGAGAMISRQISWERTATDAFRQLLHNDSIAYLMKARHILITFAEDGALYIDNTGKETKASLCLTHGGAEGSLRERIPGHFDIIFSVMATMLANQCGFRFYDCMAPDNIRQVLESGEGIMLTGFILDDKGKAELTVNITGKNWPAFDIPLKYDNKNNKTKIDSNWTIANNVREGLQDVAFDYVVKGPQVIDGLPQLSFGDLTTVDRWEIEAYQDIRNLIMAYANGEDLRPLSIAVFGAPGSGKSFGVTQIAKNILPGKIEKLEHNVSQFTGIDDLGKAFQHVRDTIVSSKLPLVFFDEFDSDKDGIKLGWLKYFLMPMQDGKFKDESGIHPLGRCILVFAGGTAASFEAFAANDNAFKEVKGPDFVSRLRGTINVLGPNRKSDDDSNHILRRALLLRSLCERKLDMTQNTPINHSIIRAMLHVPEYKHGARSMEAILNMSRISGGVWEPASLPSHAQLQLHVDADAFVKLVLS